MQRRLASRIGVFTALIMLFLAQSSGEEPKFYDLEDIPGAIVGGVDEGNIGATKGLKIVTALDAHIIKPLPGTAKTGPHDCRDRKPFREWADYLRKFRDELQQYRIALNRKISEADVKKRDYKKDYDDAFDKNDIERQKTDLKGIDDTKLDRKILENAKAEAHTKFEEVKKQRLEKEDYIKRVCPPCPPCPPDEPHCIGKCR